MTKSTALVLGLLLATSSTAFAEPTKSENANEGSDKRYELVDGTNFSNPGAMFQHLRERDNGYAAGNPREIVDAYPQEFDNVGDLIRQKRVED